MKLPQLTTDQRKNVQRGIENLRKVAKTHEDIARGMKVDALPKIWVSFPWGKPGAPPSKAYADTSSKERRKAFKGGYGVSHILAKRE